MSDKNTSAIERANAMVAALQEQYPELVARDLDRLVACWAVIQNDSTPTQANYETLYRMAHDFKGHAGSYGYPVASVIAGSICQLIKSDAVKTIGERAVMDTRVKTLELVIKERISGDASERAQKVLAELAIP